MLYDQMLSLSFYNYLTQLFLYLIERISIDIILSQVFVMFYVFMVY